jgi:RNA 2',3'-cyclic 3'-phosphodiesterase
MNNENKRLFFGFEVHAPWPSKFPKGRLLRESDRHLTIAFLGNVSWPHLKSLLPNIPLPSKKVGLVGNLDRMLFLPSRKPSVVALHGALYEEYLYLESYQKKLINWLQSHGIPVSLNSERFLPHVTICRRPFEASEWKAFFQPLPFYLTNFHLYESRPGLVYDPLWTHPLLPPFDQESIYGETPEQLRLHAESNMQFQGFKGESKISKMFFDQGIWKCRVESPSE